MSRPDQVMLWSKAGGSSKAEQYGRWWAVVSAAQRSKYTAYIENEQFLLKKWHLIWGDRLNELVMIGTYKEEQVIRQQLEGCLCNEQEISDYVMGKSFADNCPI